MIQTFTLPYSHEIIFMSSEKHFPSLINEEQSALLKAFEGFRKFRLESDRHPLHDKREVISCSHVHTVAMVTCICRSDVNKPEWRFGDWLCCCCKHSVEPHFLQVIRKTQSWRRLACAALVQHPSVDYYLTVGR